MKKFKVFLRVVGTVSMDAEADGPEEAAEKVCDSIHDDGEPKFLSLDVDDVETLMPVAYNDENGDTKDLNVPNGLVEQEVRNALIGRRMWVLTRIDFADGMVKKTATSVFMTFRRAQIVMTEEFMNERDMAEKRGTYLYRHPDDGGTECWVYSDYGETRWQITEANIHIGDGGQHQDRRWTCFFLK